MEILGRQIYYTEKNFDSNFYHLYVKTGIISGLNTARNFNRMFYYFRMHENWDNSKL